MKSAKYIVSSNGSKYAAFVLLMDSLNYANEKSESVGRPYAIEARPVDGGLTIATSIRGEFILTEYGNSLISNGTP